MNIVTGVGLLILHVLHRGRVHGPQRRRLPLLTYLPYPLALCLLSFRVTEPVHVFQC